MKRIAAVCLVLVLALACQAGAVTAYIDTFNGDYVAGPIGPMPAGWAFNGYGPPAYTVQETGLVEAPNDGTNSAFRINIPGTAGSGNIYPSISGALDNYAIPGQAIDWNYPVYVRADVFGADYTSGSLFASHIILPKYTTTEETVEWGDNGVGNAHWATVTTTVAAGQAGKAGKLYLMLDFSAPDTTDTSALIWENLRMDYTAVPEPSSLVALGTGLLGLMGLIRRRR